MAIGLFFVVFELFGVLRVDLGQQYRCGAASRAWKAARVSRRDLEIGDGAHVGDARQRSDAASVSWAAQLKYVALSSRAAQRTVPSRAQGSG